MITIEEFKALALSFPETEGAPHHEIVSFKVKKKIFATLNSGADRACVKLSPIDQDVFCGIDRSAIYPVPNKWGKQGWTNIALPNISPEMLRDAVTTAYCTVAPKQLAAPFLPDINDL